MRIEGFHRLARIWSIGEWDCSVRNVSTFNTSCRPKNTYCIPSPGVPVGVFVMVCDPDFSNLLTLGVAGDVNSALRFADPSPFAVRTFEAVGVN